MPAKKLVVSTYLQYILLAVGLCLLVVFVRQIGGVLLTFLWPPASWPTSSTPWCVASRAARTQGHGRGRRVPVVLLAVVATLLLLIIPAVGQVQTLVRNPRLSSTGRTRCWIGSEGALRRPVRGSELDEQEIRSS